MFPGIGLGMVLSKAKVLTDNMLLAASEALSNYKHINKGDLLPSLAQAPDVSKDIAQAVIKQAIIDKVCNLADDFDFELAYKNNSWI